MKNENDSLQCAHDIEKLLKSEKNIESDFIWMIFLYNNLESEF
jgi:hypothetical protein